MKQGAIKTDKLSFPDGSFQTTAATFNNLTVKNVSGAYTLTADDMVQKMIRINAGNTPANVVLPDNDQVPCPVGTKVIISSNGIGKLQFQPGPSGSVSSPQTTEIERKYGRVVAIKTSINDWEIDGQLAYQNIIEFNPVNQTTILRTTDRYGFTQPEPDSEVRTYFAVGYTGKEITVSFGSTAQGYGYQNFIPLLTRDFINVIADKLYFSASISTPGVSILDTPIAVGFHNLPADTWGEYRKPAPVGHNNPNWYVLTTRSAEIEYTIEIKVSETPSLDGYIGSIIYTVQPIKVACFIQDFSTVIDSHSFTVSGYGMIEFADSMGGSAGVVNYFDFPENSGGINEGTYFKVEGIDQASSNSGTGVLGAIYTPNEIGNAVWVNDSGSAIFKITILSDISGSLQEYAYGYISMSSSNVYGGSGSYVGESFANPKIILNDFTAGGNYSDNITFTSTIQVMYYQFSTSTVSNLTISTNGSLDTVGTLYDNAQQELDYNDNNGVDNNFEIFSTVNSGTYFIKVTPFSGATGSTQLVLDVSL